MTKTEILDLFPFLNSGDGRLRNAAEQQGVLATLSAGEYFYHKGDHCPHFALLGSGSLRVFQPSASGREITLYWVEPGNTCMVNMLCAFLGNGSPATAVVEQDVEAVLLSADTFRQWLGQSKPVQEFLFRALSQRLTGVMALVEEVAFQRLDQRLADALIRRFAKLAGNAAEQQQQPLEIIATHEDIAVELGSSREVISRLLKEFQRQGAVSLGRGRIQIQSTEMLARMQQRDDG